jgi:hypothetical protein
MNKSCMCPLKIPPPPAGTTSRHQQEVAARRHRRAIQEQVRHQPAPRLVMGFSQTHRSQSSDMCSSTRSKRAPESCKPQGERPFGDRASQQHQRRTRARRPNTVSFAGIVAQASCLCSEQSRMGRMPMPLILTALGETPMPPGRSQQLQVSGMRPVKGREQLNRE